MNYKVSQFQTNVLWNNKTLLNYNTIGVSFRESSPHLWMRLWTSELNKPPVNIATGSTVVVVFGGIRQIFTIPQTERFPWRVVRVIKRQDKRRRQTGITRNAGPFPWFHFATAWQKLAQRQNGFIARAGCYGYTNVVSYDRYITAPVRPAGTSMLVTGDVTVQVNQPYGC